MDQNLLLDEQQYCQYEAKDVLSSQRIIHNRPTDAASFGIFVVCVFSLLFLPACYRMLDESYVRNAQALDASKRYAVIRSSQDHGDIGQVILDEMISRGANVSLVDEAFDTETFDILIRYEAAWGWDVTWYLLALSISVYDARTDALLIASARYRTSLVRSSSKKAASALLDEVFGEQEQSKSSE